MSLDQVDNMTLLEIDRRVNFIIGVQRDKQKNTLKDLSCLIFYGTHYAYAATKSKKTNFEKKYHQIINTLLHIDSGVDIAGTDPENDLKKVFG